MAENEKPLSEEELLQALKEMRKDILRAILGYNKTNQDNDSLSELEKKEMEDIINLFRELNIDHKVDGNKIIVNVELKKYQDITFPVPKSVFQYKDMEIRIEYLSGFHVITVRTQDGKEFRVPITTLPFMHFEKPYLTIEFNHIIKDIEMSYDQKSLANFLRELGVKFEVKGRMIWIEGFPIAIDSYDLIIRQNNDIEIKVSPFKPYVKDGKEVHITVVKDDKMYTYWHITDVKIDYISSYLVLIFELNKKT